MNTLTTITMREVVVSRFRSDDEARSAFAEARNDQFVVLATLHLGETLAATYENTDDLDLSMGRFG
ncbi:hypothetical protein QA639_21335 [Bradyrhizobium pachyrhizi]|uniref:hypothetical protein n=1 Tax=Bradyrhizobium pachyrhizi TaxID=280333 RepID=UPI0024B17591|nr:hypothetical protein [Bradyrhizobium pachyrhizi]WFU52254.1 hypothetical protein QA639_21335 [Bradyrhizobium pachyrhizi]